MTAATLLEADNLCRSFGGYQAVRDFSLTLQRGDVVGLLGPNGAGKTTTLRMLCGCLAADSGSSRIGGHDVALQPRAAKSLLGYLPETPPLHAELKVQEYLRFAARLHGVARRDINAAVATALDSCGLVEVQQQVIGSLSKGYRQRVGLAQAIVHQPALIILDEPTDGLDPNQMRQIRGLIRKLAENHAILLSSHILSEIQAVCDRVIIMAGGRKVYEADLAEMQSESAANPIVLGFKRPPTAARLAELVANVSTIHQIEDLGAGRFRLHGADAENDPREELASLASQQGWGLLELQRESRGLDQIFAELTA